MPITNKQALNIYQKLTKKLETLENKNDWRTNASIKRGTWKEEKEQTKLAMQISKEEYEKGTNKIRNAESAIYWRKNTWRDENSG